MEHLMHAQTSRDLSEAVEGFADVDWLRAAGAVAQQHGMALEVWRVVGLRDRRSLARVHAQVLALALKLPGDEDPMAATEAVLGYMIDPVCPECSGRRFERYAGTPHLSDQACAACGGAGRRKQEWGPRGGALYGALRRMQAEALSALARKLR